MPSKRKVHVSLATNANANGGNNTTATAPAAAPGGNARSANAKRVVLTESLLATEAEKHATSKSLYGDSTARISSNVFHTNDRVRQRAYDCVFRLVKGKNVLHLGCGMGLYSMLAARHQASHVVAIDTSVIVDAARVVAEQNHLKNISFYRGRLRDVLQQLPIKKYDVVLCEWMGAFLINDAVLEDVLYARDKLLAPNGIICPDRSSLHVAGVCDYDFYINSEDYWSNVYGFTMEPMKELVRSEVETSSVPAANLVTNTVLSHTIDMKELPQLTAEEVEAYEAAAKVAEKQRLADEENPVADRWVPCAVAQNGFDAQFELRATRDTTLYYLAFFVDTSFTHPSEKGANFVIGIRPGGYNAWTEVCVMLRTPLPVKQGEVIRGHYTVRTPVERGGKVVVVNVTAETSGEVAPIKSEGEYYYQPF